MKKKHMAPGRLFAIGFALVIFIGTVLLSLPQARRPGIEYSFIDTLFTATSAVCVTGLLTLDAAATYTAFGQVVLAALIQVGGLGFMSIGVGLILLTGKKINIRQRMLLKEALNYDSFKGIIKLLKTVIAITFGFELVGMALSFIVFSSEMPFWRALGVSAFHSISSFNNAGIDILGTGTSLLPYRDNVLLNLVTGGLIIFGGIGFFVIYDVLKKKSFKRFSLTTKVVLFMTSVLLIFGTLIIKLTEGENITWLEAFFTSTSARTAGFATFQMSDLSKAGICLMIFLMFIGASPGSTGGGIKTTTFFVLVRYLFSASTNKENVAFKKKIPEDVVKKATTIAALGIFMLLISVFLLCLFERDKSLADLLFESVSALGTVGLSTGITGSLCTSSKLIVIIMMFTGRLGPLTIASLWVTAPNRDVSRPEESLAIG